MTDLVETLDRIAVDTGFSGVISFGRDEPAEFVRAYGMAHRGYQQPNTVETQFGVASGGKSFTAVAVTSLIADGVLSLDTKARSLLGEDLPLIADDVTVGHLIAHRSGIGDYIDEDSDDLDMNDHVLVSPVHRLDTTEAFLVELDGYPTKFPAGERFSYCNAGFVVLALIAERATEIGYHDLVTARVLEPGGLDDTRFLRSDEPSGRMAMGYLEKDGLRTNLLHLPVRGNGDGGIYTTVPDIQRFWRALFAGRIVPQEWVAEMIRPHSEVPEMGLRYGLGFWLGATGPNVVMIGGDAGVSFYSSHDPTTGTTLTIISNTTDGAWPLVRSISGD